MLTEKKHQFFDVLREIEDNIYCIEQENNNQYNVNVYWKGSDHTVNSRDINDSGWLNINIRRIMVKCDWREDYSGLCKDCQRMRDWIEKGPEEDGQKRFFTEYISTKVIPSCYCYSNGSYYMDGALGHRDMCDVRS